MINKSSEDDNTFKKKLKLESRRFLLDIFDIHSLIDFYNWFDINVSHIDVNTQLEVFNAYVNMHKTHIYEINDSMIMFLTTFIDHAKNELLYDDLIWNIHAKDGDYWLSNDKVSNLTTLFTDFEGKLKFLRQQLTQIEHKINPTKIFKDYFKTLAKLSEKDENENEDYLSNALLINNFTVKYMVKQVFDILIIKKTDNIYNV